MHTATVTRDADGKPTTLAAVTSVSTLGGLIKKLTGSLDPDQVVIPETMVEKASLELAPVLATALIQKRIDTGEWSYKPFMKD